MKKNDFGSDSPASEILKELNKKGLRLSTAESLTGGLLASAFVDSPGASSVFVNGAVTYSNESKIKILGVKKQTLDMHGAVSGETAEQMAVGIKKISNADIGLSTTGIAGPDSDDDGKPVGLVYIGLCLKEKTIVKKLQLKGSRTEIRLAAVASVLDTLKKELKNIN